MPIVFECNTNEEICSKVENTIRTLLEKAGFSGEAEVRVVIGKPVKCSGGCVIYNPEIDERIAVFNTLTSIFTFTLGDHMKRRGAACKFWIADGISALLALRLMEDENPGSSEELLKEAGSLVDESLLEEKFGILTLAGYGMIVPSTGKDPSDAAKAVMAVVEYLNNMAFRLSAAKAVEAKLGQAPSTWNETVEAAETLCIT